VDQLFAQCDIGEGTIIFSEDGALHPHTGAHVLFPRVPSCSVSFA
jgi:hypothetical protein